MKEQRWACDDVHIGRLKHTLNSLDPKKLLTDQHHQFKNLQDWYRFAGAITRKLNELEENKDER